MTAAALLTVVGVSLIMQYVGLSASLGAFIAGALLAESSYRHQLEADIAPFEGLLLGMFFTAIGMSLNLGAAAVAADADCVADAAADGDQSGDSLRARALAGA